jgi:hypothetical protein
MGKQYDSPVKRFPGHIIMPDYFTWEQMITWDECINKAQSAPGRLGAIAAQASGVLAMVEEWHITGIPVKPENLPANPPRPAAELLGWVIGIVSSMITEEEVPDPFLSSE